MAKATKPASQAADDAASWYKDAIFYELRVGAFHDSDNDGIGDFRGLAQRLDYLHDLGVTTLWLLPFYPSPMKDDGYDIADYTGIHPDSGSLEDFKHFLREAHRRGLKVVTELVINHTSDQHPWFQRARRAPVGSRWRNYYVWSDTTGRYPEARVIFKDFEPSNWTWDPVAQAYYWHRFYSHQPDLNFDSPDVRREVLRILDFWLKLGVDGLRLDAVPYLFERDGTICENLPETHAFLRELRAHVDARYQNRMLLAEANQWSEEAVAYFGHGAECQMAFHFPVMPRLFMALHMEDRFPIIDILTQTPEIPASCQWALFLRNHDELTLEMVTDEERDYMYRVYAHDAHARINLGIRRRLAPLLGRDRRRIELMNALLFSLPGTPVIYYGDEIGMGDNFYLGDRNGVRTPMQWSADRNAGFSRCNPQRLFLPVIVDPEYHYESVNVEAQQSNPHSFLWWMKRLIALRKAHKAFGRGSITFLHPSNRKVLAFIRTHEDEHILVVVNLSRFVQYVELDLSAYKGQVAVEMFGRTAFPPIGDLPYLLTLGPHSFYWFLLQVPTSKAASGAAAGVYRPPLIRLKRSWEQLFRGTARVALEKALMTFLPDRRWFGGKALTIRNVTIRDSVPVGNETNVGHLNLVQVDYFEGRSDLYVLPTVVALQDRAVQIRSHAPDAILAELELDENEHVVPAVLCDGIEDPDFCTDLLEVIARRRQLKGVNGELVGMPTRALRSLRGPTGAPLPPTPNRAEQSNSSVLYGNRLILKLYRRVTEGVNPDYEVGRFLTESASFSHTAPLGGGLEYRAPRSQPITVCMLQAFVPNEGDAWRYTLDQIKQYFERALADGRHSAAVPVPDARLLDLTDQDPPPLVTERLGAYIETARLLGRRTAELHAALASRSDDPLFAPEPFTTLQQRSLYQSMRNLVAQVFRSLRDRLRHLPTDTRHEAECVLPLESEVLTVFHMLLERKLGGMLIRCHGDYHLGQVLYTGKDFVIIDFEGEPARPLSERRLKRSPLRDVAGMLRSFDYAVSTVLHESVHNTLLRPEDLHTLEPWAEFWKAWVGSAFLRAYLHQLPPLGIVPRERPELDTLLTVLLLEKAVYELGYELGNRPTWLRIPARNVRDLLRQQRRSQ
jgi:maltose alpha-D-glucosyltransferase/alpha-amylase